ncbi:hypothetical protein [Saliterribacillus persicus]|nr:hypothetical protein [Saliterribacillus persicus]
MSEQELYKTILEKMVLQTENNQINTSKDFVNRLIHEIKEMQIIRK